MIYDVVIYANRFKCISTQYAFTPHTPMVDQAYMPMAKRTPKGGGVHVYTIAECNAFI